MISFVSDLWCPDVPLVPPKRSLGVVHVRCLALPTSDSNLDGFYPLQMHLQDVEGYSSIFMERQWGGWHQGAERLHWLHHREPSCHLGPNGGRVPWLFRNNS